MQPVRRELYNRCTTRPAYPRPARDSRRRVAGRGVGPPYGARHPSPPNAGRRAFKFTLLHSHAHIEKKQRKGCRKKGLGVSNF